jgi:hypothetical protein
LADPAGHPNPVSEDSCLSLLGAMMTRTGWSNDVRALTHSCLVVRA